MNIRHIEMNFIKNTILSITVLVSIISESFAANNVIGNLSGDINVSNGSLSYTLPLSMPSSIHNLNPNLSINYSQGSTSTILGAGFNLSATSSISRCTASKDKDGFNSGIELSKNSRFCHDGMKLVAINGESGVNGTEYRKYINDNTKYVSYSGSENTPDYWEQYTPSGYKLKYEKQGSASALFTSWLLKEKVDQFNNKITYFYTQSSVPLLERIEYPGYTIKFNYENKVHSLEQYQFGIKKVLNKRLKSIQLFVGNTQSYEYRFSYEELTPDNSNSQLISVTPLERLKSVTRCYGQDGIDGCLKPVEYSYLQQPDSKQILDLPENKTVVIPRSYYASDAAKAEVGLSYRPSFTSGDLNNDGFADFCYYKPKTGVVCTLHNGSNAYGNVSVWSENLNYQDNADDYKYYAALSLIDINNDGFADYCLSDRVGIRCGLNNKNGGFHTATYWMQNLYNDGQGFKTGLSNSSLPQFIDINGDGKVDVCGVGADYLPNKYHSYSCFQNTGNNFRNILLTVRDQVKVRRSLSISKGEAINMPSAKWADIDGDLDLDLCWLDFDGKFQCVYSSTDPATQKTVYSTPVTKLTLNVPQPPNSNIHDKNYIKQIRHFSAAFRYADLNGDGLIDLCYESNKQYVCHINNGIGFLPASNWADVNKLLEYPNDNSNLKGRGIEQKADDLEARKLAVFSSISLSDMNFDGLADLCAIYDGFQYCAYNQINKFSSFKPRQVVNADIDIDLTIKNVYLNFVRRWFASSTRFSISSARAAFGNFLPVSDVNNDGFTDSCYRSIDGVTCVTNDNFTPYAMLTEIKDSFGQKITVEYKNLLASGHYKAASSIPNGFYESPTNRKIVSSVITDSGAKNSSGVIRNKIDYYYEGYLINPNEKVGGFNAIEWHDTARKTKTRVEYYLAKNLIGHEKTIKEFINGQLVKQKDNQYALKPQANGTLYKVLNESTEKQNDLNGSQVSIIKNINTDFDKYALPQKTTTRKIQGSESLESVTNTQYLHNESLWLLSKPSRQTVVHTKENGQSISREVSFMYENGLLKKQTIEPSSVLKQTLEFDYDTHGNVIKTATTGSGETRYVAKTFDSLGRVLTQSNELGQQEKFEYHPRCGVVSKHTDIIGQVSRFEYDAFCRKFKESAPDSNYVLREYLWADSSDDNAQDPAGNYPLSYKNWVMFKIKETTATGAWSIKNYDVQGRIIKTESLGYSDERAIRHTVQLTAFDRYGRKTASSKPFYKTNGYGVSPNWIKIDYDNLGRPIKEIKAGPTGSPVESTYTYQGNKTTLAFEDYQKATINGLNGKPKTITENGLSINYTYDPMGNLLSTSTGGLTTTVEYDERGNKIKQHDPSMGVWEYKYNAFGELIWQKDAKGQITTFSYDKLGRKLKRTNAEGVTIWAYHTTGGGKGQLKSETTTHTAKSWAYFSNGLVKSETITVDGKTFTTVFEYDQFSRLISKTDPNGLKQFYEYDNIGSVDSVSIPQADFKDFNYKVLESEYKAILVKYAKVKLDIKRATDLANYHYARAMAYQQKVVYFTRLLNQVNQEITNLVQVADQHKAMAARYMEQVRVMQQQANILRSRYGYNEFHYIGIKNGHVQFRYNKCTKKKRSWGGIGPKKCKRYDTDNVNISLAELNPGQAGRSVKHNWQHRDILRTISWHGYEYDYDEDENVLVKYSESYLKPYQVYEKTAARWQQLANIELAAEKAARDKININNSHQILMPVEVTRQTYVPIAGDITIFVKANVKRIEYQLKNFTRAQAKQYYQNKINEYTHLANLEKQRHQQFIDGKAGVKGIDALLKDLTEYGSAEANFRKNLNAIGIETADLTLAANQAPVTAQNGRLNIWMATMRRPDGSLARELFGNGLRTVKHYNEQNGLIDRITTSAYSGEVLRDIVYAYNARGLIQSKNDTVTSKYQTGESFTYDIQGRLTGWNYSQTKKLANSTQNQSLTRTYNYDERGNIIFKTGAGTMQYNQQTNRLDSRLLNGKTSLYAYDANGNMQSGDSRTYQWTSFNKVKQVTNKGNTVKFAYDGSNKRIVKDSNKEKIYYINSTYEQVHRKAANGSISEIIHRHHVRNGYEVVATYEKRESLNKAALQKAFVSDQVAYYHRDIIGSGEIVTGSDMQVIERRFYTPYGELIQSLLPKTDEQQASTVNEIKLKGVKNYKQLLIENEAKLKTHTLLSENMKAAIGFQGDLRGYTSHENINEVGLVNMNARLYDPVIARFISADTIIPDLTRPLSYNRYSYVEGNPVLGNDPTGHYVEWIAYAFIAFVAAHDTDNEMLQMVSTIVLAATISYAAGPEFFGLIQNQFWASALTAATASTTTTFLTKGSLNSKDWRNIAWTALAAGAAGSVHGNNSSIGSWIGDDQFSWIRRAAYHSAVQGGISLLRGDGFAQGAISGLSSSLAGSAMGSAGLMGQKGFEFKMARGMIAAGFAALASDATGGDAGQAAMTALMVHMFNHEGGDEKDEVSIYFEHKKELNNIEEILYPMPLETREALESIMKSPIGDKIRASGKTIKLILMKKVGIDTFTFIDGSIFYHTDMNSYKKLNKEFVIPGDGSDSANLASQLAHEIGHALGIYDEIRTVKQFENIYRRYRGMPMRRSYYEENDIIK